MSNPATNVRHANTRLVNRNVLGATGRTSMRMEPEFWTALEEMCHREGVTAADLVTQIDKGRRTKNSHEGRTSAVKVAILEYYRAAATNDGHSLVGHGAYAPNGVGA